MDPDQRDQPAQLQPRQDRVGRTTPAESPWAPRSASLPDEPCSTGWPPNLAMPSRWTDSPGYWRERLGRNLIQATMATTTSSQGENRTCRTGGGEARCGVLAEHDPGMASCEFRPVVALPDWLSHPLPFGLDCPVFRPGPLSLTDAFTQYGRHPRKRGGQGPGRAVLFRRRGRDQEFPGPAGCRLVIVEFPTMERLQAWYASADYA